MKGSRAAEAKSLRSSGDYSDRPPGGCAKQAGIAAPVRSNGDARLAYDPAIEASPP